MTLDALPTLPPDASNRVGDDPDAALLGQRLFYDPKLSSNGRVACSTCHDPKRYFTDARPVSQGVGPTNRNAPTVVAAAYAPWQFWDGRRDSLWAQALAPFESAAEMNVSRLEVVRHVARDPESAALYGRVFGAPPLPGDPGRFPRRASPFGDAATQDAWWRLAQSDRDAIDRAFANVGKAIEAYQRRLLPGPSRFDRYVRSLVDPGADAAATALSPAELAGLRLFMDPGRTQCLRCHNGPLFTNQAFHRIGTEWSADGNPEYGRFLGIQAALIDPFNCLGAFSDAKPEDCRELRFLNTDHVEAEMGKFKTPTLRGLGQTAPYMHDGRFATLAAVVEHYRNPPPQPADALSAHELVPLALEPDESASLVAFLESLDGAVAGEARWLGPPPPTGKSAATNRETPRPRP